MVLAFSGIVGVPLGRFRVPFASLGDWEAQALRYELTGIQIPWSVFKEATDRVRGVVVVYNRCGDIL